MGNSGQGSAKDGKQSIYIDEKNPMATQIQDLYKKELKDRKNSSSEKDFFLENDNWYSHDGRFSLLFDPIKFIEKYQNYTETQLYYSNIWENIIVEKPEHQIQRRPSRCNQQQQIEYIKSIQQAALNDWRYLIRKGVCLRHCRDLIYNIFGMELNSVRNEHDSLMQFIFQDRSRKSIIQVPTFSLNDNFLDDLIFDCVDEKGLAAIKRILWCLKDTLPKLQYCPNILNCISLFFVFLDEAETYYVMKVMLENSINQLDSQSNENQKIMSQLRWHFTLNQEENEKNAVLFIDLAKKRNSDFNKIMEHFSKIQYTNKFMNLFKQWSQSYFMDILSLPTVLRFFMIYLNEGVRVFYKMIFGICLILKPKLLSEKDHDKLNLIFKESKLDENQTQVDNLFTKAYTLKIKNPNIKFDNIKIKEDQIAQKKIQVLYRPKIKFQSNIIKSYSMFEQIWQWLPKINKMTNPVLFYSTNEQGYSLNNVYQKCQEHLSKQLIMLIKSEKSIFGCYLDSMFDINQQTSFYGGNDCFVFTLKPDIANYNSVEPEEGQQNFHIFTSQQYLQIGSENAAILLKNDLKGETKCSKTYGSPNLDQDSSQFTCIVMELYYLEF